LNIVATYMTTVVIFSDLLTPVFRLKLATLLPVISVYVHVCCCFILAVKLGLNTYSYDRGFFFHRYDCVSSGFVYVL
jgi:hypothetical protein